MLQVLVNTPAHKAVAAHALGRAEASPMGATPVTDVSGIVNDSRVAAFADLEGRMVRCDSGHLWITLENDGVDHVLDSGQCLPVSGPGKAVIGGKGGFTIM